MKNLPLTWTSIVEWAPSVLSSHWALPWCELSLRLLCGDRAQSISEADSVRDPKPFILASACDAVDPETYVDQRSTWELLCFLLLW